MPRRRPPVRTAVGYRQVLLSGARVHVVQVDLNNPELRLRCVRATDLGKTYGSFKSFVVQVRPLAAITGTFFDTASGTIICNLVRDGRLLNSGSAGNTIAVNHQNDVRWLRTAGRAGGRHDWTGSEFALSGGPTLVRSGQVALDPRSEGFSDPGLFRRASRAGLATTRNGKLLMVSVNDPISLHRFARIMVKLGAQHAMNLDGGNSTGLYARGRFYSQPKRNLTNVVIVSARAPRPKWGAPRSKN